MNLPTISSSTHAARIRIIRGLASIAQATRHARAASADLGPTEPIDRMIRAAEEATDDAICRVQLLDKPSTDPREENQNAAHPPEREPKEDGKDL